MTRHTRRAAATALALATLLGLTAAAAGSAQAAADVVFTGGGRTLAAATQMADLAATSGGYDPALCEQTVRQEQSSWSVILTCSD